MKLPIRYIPNHLTLNNTQNQANMIKKSRYEYKHHRYFTRKAIPSFKHKKSKHIRRAQKLYNVNTISPNLELARKTKCKKSTLNKIVKKGKGAYFSSGSRPNQSPQSWAYARLASSLTAGKSAAVDFNIINTGCNHTGIAFKLAKKARNKYNFGHAKTKKKIINI